MKDGNNKIFKSLFTVLIICALALGIAILSSWFTNGWESVSSLYLKSNGAIVGSELRVAEDQETVIKVKAANFTKVKDYTVSIIPNAANDFEYTADGRRYKLSSVKDLSKAFGVQTEKTEFSFEGISIKQALSRYHGGAEIVIGEELSSATSYLKLVVSSNSGLYTVSVALLFYVPLEGITTNNVIFFN